MTLPMPEHDKFRPHRDEAQTIGEFLEWLEAEAIRRMKWGEEFWEERCPVRAYRWRGDVPAIGSEIVISDRDVCFEGRIVRRPWAVNSLDFEDIPPADPEEQGVTCPICKGEGYVTRSRETWISDGRTKEQLIASFFGIDLPAFNAEKEALYQQIAAEAR